MQTLMLTVEYDGTRYAGWKAAPKKENLDTVLGRIHTALARLLKEDIQLFCAAKTDPGVHARGQILSFQTTSSLLPSALKSSLNQVLPQDIAVLDARQVSERFHAELLPKHCIWSFVSKPVRLLMFSVRSILYFSPTCRIPCECRKHFLF